MRSRLELRLREQVAGPILHASRPLLLMAAYAWRRALVRTTFIGITGSLGKTTTKETLANILGSQARTFRSYRNQNNTMAVALNILRVRPWHRYAVIEAAGSSTGMLKQSARILAPDVAVILNVLRTHTTAFPDLQDHADEKAELLHALGPGKLAILNADDPLVSQMKVPQGVRVKRFGNAANADFRVGNASSKWPDRLSFTLDNDGTSHHVATQLVGAHWVGAAAAAAATAMSIGIDPAATIAAIGRAEPFPARLQPMKLPCGAIVLRDDYSATADAVETALNVLGEASALRKIFVITDMSDFGRNRRQRLKHLASRAANVADTVVFVGYDADYGARRAQAAGVSIGNAHGFLSLREAADHLRRDLREGDLILIKGRTTDHSTRLFLAQLGEIKCWLEYCPKRMLCDTCWELGASQETLARAAPMRQPRTALPLAAEEIKQ